MRVVIENTNADALRFAADYIVSKIKEANPTEAKPYTVVLPDPLPSVKLLFDDLVRAFEVGRISYKHVVFFQLEEFRDIPRTDKRSFAWRLYDYFFKFVDANPHNVFFLNGTSSDFDRECELFEDAIKRYGGINLMCLQVSSEASIGGNAPGSCLTSRTRPKTTTSFVINDRSYTRNGLGDIAEEDIIPVDEYAIGSNYVLTMGLGTIMDAEEVIALFIGPPAARALHHVLEGSVSNMFPASVLQYHTRACIVSEHRSISTLKFTTVEYFMGIRENFNIVNSLPALQTTRESPYHHAVKFTQQLPSELFLGATAESYREPARIASQFAVERTSLSPLMDSSLSPKTDTSISPNVDGVFSPNQETVD